MKKKIAWKNSIFLYEFFAYVLENILGSSLLVLKVEEQIFTLRYVKIPRTKHIRNAVDFQ